MIVLDENINWDQREYLLSWRIRVRQIGFDIGSSGMKDREQIIPLLHSLRQPALFTRDRGFYNRPLVHKKYGLVYLAVEPNEVAEYVRMVLRHRLFNTKATRVGKVMCVNDAGIRYWQFGVTKEKRASWKSN